MRINRSNTSNPHAPTKQHGNIASAALMLALAAGAAHADVTIPGDVVVPPGGTLIINDNTIYTGTLTIGAGAQVVVDSGFRIEIASGATLAVNGSAAEPVIFFPINASWDGLNLRAGSTATLSGAIITDIRDIAIEINGAVVTMTECEIFDTPGFGITHASRRYAIIANTGADLSIDRSIVGPMLGRNGSTGGTGNNGSVAQGVTAIDARAVEAVRITNTLFVGIEGGSGGNGGQGSTGSTGAAGNNAVIGTGGTGGDGGPGGEGGDGGAGGSTILMHIENVGQTLIAQNIFDQPQGGRGGAGGKGGTGGKGGKGGRGGPGVFGDGGRGGTGGKGGPGGKGGAGGTTGPLQVMRIVNPISAPIIASNTLFKATARIGGAPGAVGSGGAGGAGGDGGSAGIGGSTGPTGTAGASGSNGSAGPSGATGRGDAVVTTGADASGFAAVANNNIMTFDGPGTKQAFLSTDDGIIDAFSNNVANANILGSGPVIGSLSIITTPPTFMDEAIGDFSPAPGSPAIDAGDNTSVPASLTIDYLGNPRFVDDLDTPDTGLGFAPIVDFGAIERPGAACAADYNGDGLGDILDFLDFIDDFSTCENGPGPCGSISNADFNGDTIVDILDFLDFISAFADGC